MSDANQSDTALSLFHNIIQLTSQPRQSALSKNFPESYSSAATKIFPESYSFAGTPAGELSYWHIIFQALYFEYVALWS